DQSGSAAGIGLGLYICRCIVEAHRGTIDVQSSEHGTTFTVRIPFSVAA
ncbi:ATP-binding protein, partial [Escherichia coli]|nr:ATP-binding protein [Escherichia coli]